MSATKKKLIVTIFAMIVITVSFVYGTVAYFTDSVTSVGSNIATGSAKAQIADLTYSSSDLSSPLPEGAAVDVLPGYSFAKSVTAKSMSRNVAVYTIVFRIFLYPSTVFQ